MTITQYKMSTMVIIIIIIMCVVCERAFEWMDENVKKMCVL